MSRRWLKKDFPEPWADREERAMKDRLSGLLALVPAEDRARALGKPPDYSKRVYDLVERFGRRGTEPNELFRSEFGQNSWNPKKTTKAPS